MFRYSVVVIALTFLPALNAPPLQSSNRPSNPLLDRLTKTVGYAEKIREAVRANASTDDLEVRVIVIPDAYVYSMAVGIESLVKSRYHEDMLERKLRELHREHKSKRGKVLLIVDIQTPGHGHCLMKKKMRLFTIRSGGNKSVKIKKQKPQLRFEAWQVFQYPPNKMRKIGNHQLAVFEELRFTLTCPRLKVEKKDPFTFYVSNIMKQTRTGSAMNSINVNRRQLSCTTLNSLILPPIEMTFHPGSWAVPEQPGELREVLATVASVK